MNAADLFKKNNSTDLNPIKILKQAATDYLAVFKPPYKTQDITRIVITLFLFLTIPLTVFVANQVRDNRSNAAGVPDKSKSYNMPVLVLKYFPTQDGVNLDPNITGITSTLTAMRSKVDTITSETKAALQSGSTFHGYKDANATPALNYSIYEQKEFLQSLPLGLPLKPGVYRPDYMTILQNQNICNYVENLGVREVWLYGWHYGNIEPVESNMAGPHGDISNSERTNDMPVCAKTYVLYNYNYGRGTAEAVHDHGHQIEVMLKSVGDPLFENNYIGPWGTYGANDGSGGNFHRCGWTHAPPNTSTEYDYANSSYVWTDCEDWKLDGSGQKVSINCTEWQCDQVKFHVWRWQNMPGKNNLDPSESNWWDFIGDFDNALNTNEKLFYDLQPPTIPTGLAVNNIYSSQLTLTWNASTDNFGVDYYTVRKNGVVIATTSAANFIDFAANLNSGSVFTYTVSATDVNGNTSAESSSVQVSGTNFPSPPALTKPALDSISSTTGTSSNTYSWYHNVGTGPNRLLIVGVSIRKSSNETVSSITFGGTPLTPIGVSDSGSRTEFWKLASPASGRNQITVNLTGSPTGSVAGATTWYGADPTNITFQGAVGFSSNPSLIIHSSSSEVVQDLLVMPGLSSDVVSPGSGQTSLWNLYSSGDTKGASSYQTGSSSTTVSWLTKNEAWSMSAVSLKLKTTKFGDLNSDGRVNILDVSQIIDKWGATNKPPEDLNQDGRVDILDISLIIDNWF